MCEDNLVIQSLWVGPRLSTMERLCIRSYQANRHDFTLYSYTPVENVPEGTTVKDANEIVPESDITRFRNLANFSDWFRYNLLFKKGGWWSDTDSVCVKPLDFSSDCVFSSEVVRFATGSRGHTNCGNIKVPAGSEIMRWCVEQVQKTDTRTNTWSQIGPVLLKAAVERFDLTKYIQDGYVFCPLGWQDCPEAFLSPIPPRINPQAYCIHLYNEMWQPSGSENRKSADKDGNYPSTCLYSQLKARYL